MCASYVQCHTNLRQLLTLGVGVPEATALFERREELSNLWIDLCGEA